jgi:hypothetical protein
LGLEEGFGWPNPRPNLFKQGANLLNMGQLCYAVMDPTTQNIF